tara:strand:- start:158 stop:967 length:810 start_codon:yes stop_codon:yes gene_type:complete
MAAKTLYVNGCSWSEGHGIESDPIISAAPITSVADMMKIRHQFAWPGVLAELTGSRLINESIGGGSNTRIARMTCEYLQSLPDSAYKELVVVLGWTTVDRDEIYLKEKDIGAWGMRNATQRISDYRVHEFSNSYFEVVDKWQKEYVTLVYNYKRNYLRFFQQMYLMHNMLENLGIQHLFFNSLPFRRHPGWCSPKTVDIDTEFKTQINALKKPNILSTRDCDDALNVMYVAMDKHKFAWSADLHPMVSGHRMWAEHLFEEMKALQFDFT